MEAKININMQVCLDFSSRKIKNKPFCINCQPNSSRTEQNRLFLSFLSPCVTFGSRKINKPFSIRSVVKGVGVYDIKPLSFAYFNKDCCNV